VNAARKAEYELRKGISVSLSARNLFDDKYQLVDGFPEAGRSYQLAIKTAY
jgi:iron complex outermembrane receptor protein